MSPLTVARRFVASYLNVGDIVLYGKYKNHRGKIVTFGQDKWGNPTIEIEPIPKGRKKNKVMGLFKVWRADVKEKALAEMNKEASSYERSKEFYEVWAERLDKEAKDLNLKDSEDRSTFRMNIHNAVQNLKADGLKDLAEKMGAPVSNSRDSLVKAIANAYIAGKRIKTASSDLTKRVVARYVKAFGIELGRTVEVGSIRIHRFRDHFRVWDLTNAGKRGKKVETITISPTYAYKGNHDDWSENFGKMLVNCDSLAQVKSAVKDVLQDYPGEIEMHSSTLRGIDVNPGGTTVISIETNTGLVIKASPLEFTVTHRAEFTGPKGKFHQDTNYWSRSKKDAAPFYNWIKANLGEANRKTILELRELWSEMGIQYDYH